MGQKWRFWALIESDDLFLLGTKVKKTGERFKVMTFCFKEHYTVALKQNQLENVARVLKSLLTPDLDRDIVVHYDLFLKNQ